MPQLLQPAEAFELVATELAMRQSTGVAMNYKVPRFLLESTHSTDLTGIGNPYNFFIQIFDQISENSFNIKDHGSISHNDFIYLTFLRTFASLNGEIGTPLKQIAFLPFLRELGVSILISLPTGVMGSANRKGTRGSPFAVADPFDIDPSMADPLLPGIDSITQYQAMVHAYGIAGIRCGSIVPLATLSIDSHLVRQFPSTTYWWKMPPGSSLTPSTIVEGSKGTSGSPDSVTKIAPRIASKFMKCPHHSGVTSVRRGRDLFWQSADGLTPASACPDVLGGEDGTYSWPDVAGVRYGKSIIPNLSRVTEPALSTERSVQIMALAVAWRAAILGERIFWTDVAARVPDAVLKMAVELFDGWSEQTTKLCAQFADPTDDTEPLLEAIVAARPTDCNPGRIGFIAEELFSFNTQSHRYNAVVGPFIFCVGPFTHDPQTLRESLRYHIGMLADQTEKLPFLAGIGDHDSIPPSVMGSSSTLAAIWLLNGSMPFIFSGLEHNSQVYVNREFGFNTTDKLRKLRTELDETKLALFNDVPFPWNHASSRPNFRRLIRSLLDLRSIANTANLFRLEPLAAMDDADYIVGYTRKNLLGDELTILLNTSHQFAHTVEQYEPSGIVLSVGDRSTDDGTSIVLTPLALIAHASPGLHAKILETWGEDGRHL